MKNFYRSSWVILLSLFLTPLFAQAQSTITGRITDNQGEGIPGVNIIVKGSSTGTTSNATGDFSLTVTQALPVTLVASFVGLQDQELVVTTSNTSNLSIVMSEAATQLVELTVLGINAGEKQKAPVTVESVNTLQLQTMPTAEVFEGLSHIKGVQMTYSSMNFPQINTRGFATVANTRFVQLIDGMDCSAPLLNFPTGNIVGISEIDLESMELQPGSASAIWGPNAFNGILLMNSKNPFTSPGLTVQAKVGYSTSDAMRNDKSFDSGYPLFNYGFRFAHKFSEKLAAKANFSIFDAHDWVGNDYKTDRDRPGSTEDLSSAPDFNGINLYGDEIALPVPLQNVGTIHRTGWKESDLVDNYDATSRKWDIALHYRPNDNVEISANYRNGSGNSVYQGSQKYALRDFRQDFYKLELRSRSLLVRGYVTATNAGDSYNIGALGSYLNESIKPSPQWAQEYTLAMQGYFIGAGVPGGSHTAARAFADRDRPEVGSAEYKTKLEEVRNNYFQRTPPGAKFIDESRLYHAQFNYDITPLEDIIKVQIGGNFRQYSLFSDATVFNEAPEGGEAERIIIDEYGLYTQLAKEVGDFNFTGSIRYDKNENFEGRLTPRVSAVYTISETSTSNHNIRASFQTGFRNPDTQAQFIYFDLGTNILLGSVESNAARYGLHNGGAYTKASWDKYRTTGNTGDLVEANIPYVKPEQLKSWELGYRGYSQDMSIDLVGYYTTYRDFIGGDNYVLKNPTTHQGKALPAGTVFSPYVNFPEDVTSYGIGIGISYNLPNDFVLSGNYNYATFEDNRDENSQFRAGFNTPENKFNIGISRTITSARNFGFNLNYRYQQEFEWQSDFGVAMIPEFGVFDAQVSYKLASIKTIVKLSGSNILGGDYRTNFGGPFVGQQYVLSLTFDQPFSK
jgi:iron complex outermembrane recepter protein